MARDYGRRTNTRRSNNTPRRIVGVLAAFLGGYLTATIFDVTSLSTWVNDHLLADKQATPPHAKIAKRQPDLPKPKFEFYTLLSKDNREPAARKPVTIPSQTPANVPQPTLPQQTTSAATPAPVQHAAPIAEAKPATPVAASTRGSYLVQVAAFNKREEAENLKATLTLKGFDVSITTITTQQRTNWYRVMIGPFHSREEAQQAQSSLAHTEHIKGLIRRFDA